jgi:hypothetical protein
VHLVTREGVSGRASLRYRLAIDLFDGYSIRREHRALVGSSERRDRRAFLVQPRGEPTRIRVRQKTLECKEASTAYDRCIDFRVLAPTINATVRIEDFAEQLVHKRPPSRRGWIDGGSTEGISTDDMAHAPWVVLW